MREVLTARFVLKGEGFLEKDIEKFLENVDKYKENHPNAEVSVEVILGKD